MESVLSKIKSFLGSNNFIKLVLLLVASQGLWYALAFQPTIFDEGRHIGFIEMYADKINPFISEQGQQWDYLGETTRDPNYFYYYAMSIPWQVFSLLTDSFTDKVVLLRMLHIAMFAGAIWIYQKALIKLGFNRAITNLSLLLIVLTPAIAPLAGAVTYDTPSFLFSGLLLFLAAKIIQSKKIKVEYLLLLLITFNFGSLFKYTFIAFALPIGAFILWDIVSKKKYKKIQKVSSKRTLAGLVILCFLGIGLFIERPLKNQLVYGSVVPSCVDMHGEERCAKSYVWERNLNALANKPVNFEPKSLYEFTFIDWIPNMVRSQVRLNPWDSIISPLFVLYTMGLFAGVFFIIYRLDLILTKRTLILSLLTIVGLSLILLFENYKSYVNLGEVVATSSRYLLPAQPIFTAAALFALNKSINPLKYITVSLFGVLLVIGFARGGGIITYAKQAPDQLQWSARD